MTNLITFQDAFRKIQTVESIYLNDTVQHFRNHAMELSKADLKELTDVLENDVCREIERITADLHLEVFQQGRPRLSACYNDGSDVRKRPSYLSDLRLSDVPVARWSAGGTFASD